MRRNYGNISESLVLSALKECTRAKDLTEGKKLHEHLAQRKLDTNSHIASSLINLYSKCSQMREAQKVFDSMKSHDVVSWTALMLGYAENRQETLALDLLTRMTAQGCLPDSRTLLAVLKACIGLSLQETGSPKLKALERAMYIHSRTEQVFELWDIYVESTLVDLYSKCGSMTDARRVFDCMARHDVVSWTALMLGYAESEEEERSLQVFEWMIAEGCRPNSRSFVVVLKACTRLARARRKRKDQASPLEIGMALHSLAVKSGCESLVTNTLIEMYATFGRMDYAGKVFENMLNPDEVTWNVLMLGYVENGEPEKALKLFEKMALCSSMLNTANFVAALKACAAMDVKDDDSLMKKLETCMSIHSLAVSRGLEHDQILSSTLLDSYTRCGSFSDAERVFHGMNTQDVVSCTSLMLGQVENGRAGCALKLFSRMKARGCSPDPPTYAAALKASGSQSCLESGVEVHGDLCRSGLEHNLILLTCLVDMYAKCGRLTDSRLAFDSVNSKETETWTALLAGYSLHGEIEHVFYLFEAMRREGVRADGVTFVCLLTACSHAGLVQRGREYFRVMECEYGITPRVEHHVCMAHMLERIQPNGVSGGNAIG